MSDVETISRLAEILGSTGGAAVGEYTTYFIYNSLTWIVVGLLILIPSLLWKTKDLDWDFPAIIIKALLVFIALCFIGCNLPDIFAPKAMAIHQIIRDVRGN